MNLMKYDLMVSKICFFKWVKLVPLRLGILTFLDPPRPDTKAGLYKLNPLDP
jgi:hypothetical protein